MRGTWGQWITPSSHGLFNFAPGVRPCSISAVNGIDIVNFEARMQAMARPVYSAICQHAADGEPSIVFVPTRKHAKLASLDLLTFAAADGKPKSSSRVIPRTSRLTSARSRIPAVRHALGFGVALLHESMDSDERELVERVFSSGAATVLVVTAPLAWGLTASCKLSVIMGTQYYDAGGAASADYPVTDLLAMMGRAARPLHDDHSVCVCCAMPRKEYYKKFPAQPFPR